MEKTLASLFTNVSVDSLQKRGGAVKYKSERAELIDRFYQKLAEGYKAFTGRELTFRYLGLRLAHVKTDELHAFYKKCCEARSFPEYFWGRLKVVKLHNEKV